MAQEVEFHTGVADPLGFACRLLRKASRLGARIVCTAPADTLAALDRALWAFEERDFVPHVRVPGAKPPLARRTPIWLAEDASVAEPGQVLVNLGAEGPAEPGGFARIIEIVGTDADEAAAARARWRAYKAAGLEIRHHAAG